MHFITQRLLKRFLENEKATTTEIFFSWELAEIIEDEMYYHAHQIFNTDKAMLF